MSFTDVVQGKIAARRADILPQALAKAARDKHLRQVLGSLIATIEAMRDRLGEDKLFADVIGRPELALQPWNDDGEDGGTLKLVARLAVFTIQADAKRDRLNFRILPDLLTTHKLNCSIDGYSPDGRIRGRSADLNAFLAAIEDHIADFIADIAVSPAADLLDTSRSTAKDLGSLTRY